MRLALALAATVIVVATLVATLISPAASGAQAPETPPESSGRPAVVIALLSEATRVEDFSILAGLSPGAMSAGLSTVPSTQTYLDISQGNRIFTSLYPGDDIPEAFVIGDRVPGWPTLVERAKDAPGDLVPGLLAQTLEDAGIPIRVEPALRTPALMAANRSGEVDRGSPGDFDCVERRCPPGVTAIQAERSELPLLVAGVRGEDMLIAFERPPPPGRRFLALGIAGRGFDGQLTSDTTRTKGFVTSTDLAPTILRRFGLAVPEQMNGKPIRTEGEPDAVAISERNARIAIVPARRPSVIFYNALLWLVATALVIAAFGRRGARFMLPWLALSCVYLPLVLLGLAALDPIRTVERFGVGFGAPALALLTLRLARGYAALAIACTLTIGAYAIDLIAGSPFTSVSLIGPNPAIGVRFFGIGNELEATVAVLVPVGTGAWLAARGWGAHDDRRRAALAFLAAGGLATVVFAAGRFGADVGAAIVLPVGAAVAAAVIAGISRTRRNLILIAALPLLALAALAALDLILGGGAHLTGSVLEAGGADDLADVAERRLRLSGKSFYRAAHEPWFYVAAAALIFGIVRRERLRRWFEGSEPAYAGFCGGAAATLVGMLVNDSGAILLMVGTAFLLACAGFAWVQGIHNSETSPSRGSYPRAPEG